MSIKPTDKFKVEGDCGHCGQCCSELILSGDILDKENIIKGLIHCKHAYEDNGKVYCGIVTRVKQDDPDKDISIAIILTQAVKEDLELEQKDVDFFEESIDFPNPDNPCYHPFRFNLKEKCPLCSKKVIAV